MSLILGFAASLLAQGVEKVVNQDGKVQAQVGGNLLPMKAAVAFPGGILINTNGTFKVNNGTERKLENGQSITPDGMLHKPDGSVGPVTDHYVIQGARKRNDHFLRWPNEPDVEGRRDNHFARRCFEEVGI